MKAIKRLATAAAWLILFCGSQANATLRIVTTDTTLADLARAVGGDRVQVESLSRGTDDPHHVEPLPSMVVKLARADAFVRIGMDLDMWADSLLDRCGNRRVQKGGTGYVDCSSGVKVLEPPSGRLDPSMGDIHAYGNPHYLLDPGNGIVAAGNIAAGLIRSDPAGRTYFGDRFAQLAADIRSSIRRWSQKLAPISGSQVVVYHRSWVYFFNRFRLREFAAIEPKPGVPASPGHVQSLIRGMKAQRIVLVMCERWHSRRFPDLIAAQTGARAVFLPTNVEAEPGITSYIGLFDAIVGRIAEGAG